MAAAEKGRVIYPWGSGTALEDIAAIAFSALFYAALVMASRLLLRSRACALRADRRAFGVKFGRDMLRKFLFLGYARRFRQEGLLWLYGFSLADVACVLLVFRRPPHSDLLGRLLPALASRRARGPRPRGSS